MKQSKIDRSNYIPSNVMATSLTMMLAAVATNIQAANVTQIMGLGDHLEQGQRITIPERNCYLEMRQDGNLVLSAGQPGSNKGIIWSSTTSDKRGDYYTLIQGDGNFIIYKGTYPHPTAVHYATNATDAPGNPYFLGVDENQRLTANQGTPDSISKELWSNVKYSMATKEKLYPGEMFVDLEKEVFMTLSKNGKLIVYEGTSMLNKGKVVWSTRPTSTAQRHYLSLQTDGNLVIYAKSLNEPLRTIYASQTRSPVYHLGFDEDKKPIAIDGEVEDPRSIIWKAGETILPTFVYSGNYTRPAGADYLVWPLYFIDGTGKRLLTKKSIHHEAKGARVVWDEMVNGKSKVFYFDGNVIRKISGTKIDSNPKISGGNIAFEREIDGQKDIVLWKNGVARVISNSPKDDINPDIFGERIVWQGYDGNDWEIYHYGNQRVTQISSNELLDEAPKVSSKIIVWVGDWPMEDWPSDMIYYTDLNALNTVYPLRSLLNPTHFELDVREYVVFKDTIAVCGNATQDLGDGQWDWCSSLYLVGPNKNLRKDRSWYTGGFSQLDLLGDSLAWVDDYDGYDWDYPFTAVELLKWEKDYYLLHVNPVGEFEDFEQDSPQILGNYVLFLEKSKYDMEDVTPYLYQSWNKKYISFE